MTQITGVAGAAAGRIEPFGKRTKEAPVEPAPTRAGSREVDQVELSETARRAGGVGDAPVRMELIERIKREIEAGTYETPEKIDAAAERLARVLDLEA